MYAARVLYGLGFLFQCHEYLGNLLNPSLERDVTNNILDL